MLDTAGQPLAAVCAWNPTIWWPASSSPTGKDQEFAAALIAVRLVDAQTLRDRISLLPISDSDRRRLHDWVTAVTV